MYRNNVFEGHKLHHCGWKLLAGLLWTLPREHLVQRGKREPRLWGGLVPQD